MIRNAPQTAEQIIAEVTALCEGKGSCIFRGTPIAYSQKGDDQINSSIYRRMRGIFNENFSPKYIQEDAIDGVRKRGFFPEGTDDTKIMSEIRHFGGLTNTIDFTRKLGVALFFACRGEFDENGEIIIIPEKEITNADGEDTPGIIEPTATENSRKRIEFQNSVFVSANKGYVDKKFYTQYTIKKDLKRRMLVYLKEFENIKSATIYNDLIGFIANQDEFVVAQTYFLIGMAKARANKYEEAIRSFSKAIKLHPSYIEALINRGNCRLNLKQYSDSIKDFDIAIDLNLKDSSAFTGRGAAQGALGKYEESLGDLDEAIKLDPSNAEAFFNKGLTQSTQGDDESAVKNYDRALELQPNDARAIRERGVALAKLKKYEAIEDFNRVLEAQPNDALAFLNRGVFKLKMGKTNEAIKDLDKAIELNPNDGNAFFNRWLAKSELNLVEEAKEDFKQAVKLNHLFMLSFVCANFKRRLRDLFS